MTSTLDGLCLRRMGLHDLEEVVGAHLAAFPDGFFARLGRRYLVRYYRTFLDGPLAVALVAENGGRMAGYLVGIVDPPRHRRLVFRYHGVGLAGRGAVGLVMRPRLLAQFVGSRARRYAAAVRRHCRTGTPGVDHARVAVLSHLVVVPECRRGGVGRGLVTAFLEQAAAAGCSRACLVTIDGVGGASDFYAKQGWTHTATRQAPDGRALAHFELDLVEV